MTRYRQLTEDYAALQAAKGSASFTEQLFRFHAQLRQGEDDYLISAIQPDLESRQGEALARLSATLKRAQSEWDAYQGDGGIPGVMRVEGRVSERYTRQARRLTAAYSQLQDGSRTYKLLQAEPPPQWAALERAVTSEADRQNRAMHDLGMVLEPALLRAKQKLLPTVAE